MNDETYDYWVWDTECCHAPVHVRAIGPETAARLSVSRGDAAERLRGIVPFDSESCTLKLAAVRADGKDRAVCLFDVTLSLKSSRIVSPKG